MDYNLIATATFGLEAVVAKELKELGYEDLKTENGRVHFEGDEMDIRTVTTFYFIIIHIFNSYYSFLHMSICSYVHFYYMSILQKCN